jgi:hypothetical protein
VISESGKQTETTNGKKISFDSFTDKIKEKVTEKSIKEGSASTVGRETTGGDDKAKDLNSGEKEKEKYETPPIHRSLAVPRTSKKKSINL